MSPPTPAPRRDPPREVLLLDFWAEQNRGDAAMQAGMLGLVRKHLPSARVTVMAASGANQWPALAHQLEESAALADEVVGGLRPWMFGPFRSGPFSITPVRKAASMLCAAAAVTMLAVWPAMRRIPWLDRMLPRSARQSVRVLRAADMVLWNCRNLRGRSWLSEPYEVAGRLYDAMVALQFGKPVACIGLSAWPLRNPASRFLTRMVLGRMCFISTRDASSHEYVTSLVKGRAVLPRLLPDLSMAVLARHVSEDRSHGESLRRLGLTLVDRGTDGSASRARYAEAVRGFLSSFLERDGTEVVLIPQVTNPWQSTNTVVHTILEGVDPSRVICIEGEPTVDELISIYRSLDLLVATRMHSAIFALSQGTPAVTIPYVVGGKWGILDMMDAQEIDQPYDGITAEALGEKVESVWRRRQELAGRVRAAMPALCAAVEDNIALPIAAYRSMDLEGVRR